MKYNVIRLVKMSEFITGVDKTLRVGEGIDQSVMSC